MAAIIEGWKAEAASVLAPLIALGLFESSLLKGSMCGFYYCMILYCKILEVWSSSLNNNNRTVYGRPFVEFSYSLGKHVKFWSWLTLVDL